MKFSRPYIIESKNFIQVYYGGGCNPKKLKATKRQSIKKFTRASQKRLCEKIECAQKYKPTLILKMTFPENIKVKDTNLLLIKFFGSLKKYFADVYPHIPLIFWRKNFCENKFWISLLIDYPLKYNIQNFLFVINMYWKMRVGNDYKIEVYDIGRPLSVSQIKSFCFDNCTTTVTDVGRWWGVVYAQEHKFKKLKRKYYSIEEIKEVVKNLNKLETSQIKRNLYEKNTESN